MLATLRTIPVKFSYTIEQPQICLTETLKNQISLENLVTIVNGVQYNLLSVSVMKSL